MRNGKNIISGFMLSATLAASTQSASVSANNAWGITAEYSPWLAHWEQRSGARSKFGDDAIQVNYDIDTTLAHQARLIAHVGSIQYTAEITQSRPDDNDFDKSLGLLSFAIRYSGLGQTRIDYRFLHARFDGYISGSDNNGRTGSGSFTTDLILHDAMLAFTNGFNIGYRYSDYQLPQDLYLINTSQPGEPVIAGFADMRYQGHYLTAGFEKTIPANDRYGLHLHLLAGIGRQEPDGDFLRSTESNLRKINAIDNNDSLMDTGESHFYELDSQLFRDWKASNHLTVRLAAGYRYSASSSSFKGRGQYALLADFNTLLHGPYLGLTLHY